MDEGSLSNGRVKIFQKPSNLYHIGIHWIALAEYSQMSVPMCHDFSHFSGILHHFVLAKLATSSISVQESCTLPCAARKADFLTTCGVDLISPDMLFLYNISKCSESNVSINSRVVYCLSVMKNGVSCQPGCIVRGTK